ncbi:MAG: hypothetical protein JWO21_817 [Solirubrobacterales bacterium]|jgi:hypothetical protein|nr:hypothetical protein [Solirubrobacterales bacterium]
MNVFGSAIGRRTAERTKQLRGIAVSASVLALAVLAVGADGAWAGSGTTLCIPKKEGSAVFTPKHGACRKGYHLTTLGVEGNEGQPGANGKPGADGKAGSPGVNGAPGEPGKPGLTGPEGKSTGVEGKEGKEGKEGPEGKTGLSKSELELLKGLLSHIQFVSSGVGKKPTIQFYGVNVQVVSGAGKTSATVNGLGNLVIGYDENVEALAQTGSHNLVLGEEQMFTSYGGILAGFKNAITGPFASVTGGGYNKATFKEAAVSGGWLNTASNENATVSGGRENAATNEYSTVSGGSQNTASGKYASIFGGKKLTAAVEFEAIP